MDETVSLRSEDTLSMEQRDSRWREGSRYGAKRPSWSEATLHMERSDPLMERSDSPHGARRLKPCHGGHGHDGGERGDRNHLFYYDNRKGALVQEFIEATAGFLVALDQCMFGSESKKPASLASNGSSFSTLAENHCLCCNHSFRHKILASCDY